MEAYHRANLVSNLYPGNPMYAQSISSAARTIVTNTGNSMADAQAGAMRLLDGRVMAQATTMAYNDAFLLLGLTFFFAVPAVFLLRKAKKAAPGGGGGH